MSSDRGWDFHGIEPGEELPDIDTSMAHSARIYDYILGGCFLQTHTNSIGSKFRYPT